MRKFQALSLSAALLASLLLGGCANNAASSDAASSDSAASEPEATPEPTPAPPAANPLTGAADADYTGKRPVAVTLRNMTGSTPQWGIASADVLVEGVTEGTTASLMALYANPDSIAKAGPVGPARDLLLQVALPLNAVPVHIDKNIYASNLLNTLAYQDLDGYHIGKTAFAFDQDRQNAGYAEENCWYTTAELINSGLASYGVSLNGDNTPLFQFGERPAVDPADRSGMNLTITFSPDDIDCLNYDTGTGLYALSNGDGSPVQDADNGQQVGFTNVFVFYASSGIKDDGYTRQYDMTAGTGLYLHGGAWERINWTKEDATGPFVITNEAGETLVVSQGKSFIAIWGGYYGQSLSLTAADGSAQTLPDKPALLNPVSRTTQPQRRRQSTRPPRRPRMRRPSWPAHRLSCRTPRRPWRKPRPPWMPTRKTRTSSPPATTPRPTLTPSTPFWRRLNNRMDRLNNGGSCSFFTKKEPKKF